MAWIQVTDLVGRTVYLSTEQVVRVRPFVPANDAPPASGSHGPHDHKDIDMTSAKSVVDLVNVQQEYENHLTKY
jgi:hypothetical protein